MTDRALNEDALPVRAGQIRLRTQCWYCDKTFPTPSAAAKHALKHPKSVDKGGKNGPSRWIVKPSISAPVSGKDARSDLLSTEKERQRLLAISWPLKPRPRMCAWCGVNVTRETATAHHLLPRKFGGSDEPENLALVHLSQCHDLIELWTAETERAPNQAEWGQLNATYGNTLVEGVGNFALHQDPPEAEPPYGVENIGQIKRYLAFLAAIGND